MAISSSLRAPCRNHPRKDPHSHQMRTPTFQQVSWFYFHFHTAQRRPTINSHTTSFDAQILVGTVRVFVSDYGTFIQSFRSAIFCRFTTKTEQETDKGSGFICIYCCFWSQGSPLVPYMWSFCIHRKDFRHNGEEKANPASKFWQKLIAKEAEWKTRPRKSYCVSDSPTTKRLRTNSNFFSPSLSQQSKFDCVSIQSDTVTTSDFRTISAVPEFLKQSHFVLYVCFLPSSCSKTCCQE